MKHSVYKSFLVFTGVLFVVSLSLLYNSPLYSLHWGKWKIHTFQSFLPLIVLGLIILTIFVFQREIKLAKTEQREKDCNNFIKILQTEKEQLQQLIKKYGITEEKVNAIWEEIKDKISLGKLNNLPELAITLIEKIIYIKDEYGVKLTTQITGDISYLKNIHITDLKQTIDLMLTSICDHIKNYETEPKRDINLFIREIDNKIMFKTMHDYADGSINTEMIEWNIKKILHKYGGDFKVLNEKEEESDMFVLSLIVDIPKEVKVRKIV